MKSLRSSRSALALLPVLVVMWVHPLAFQATSTQTLVLTNAQVIDASGAAPYRAAIVVSEGKIASIERDGAGLPQGGRRIDLKGKFLLPGFIDAHVHIGDRMQARRALLSGVTTARSMGTSNFADVGLRELVRRGGIDGPEILAVGYHVRPGMSDAFFLDEPPLFEMMEGVQGADAFRRVTEANLSREVDFIKVVATDRAGLPETDPRRQITTLEELEAVVEAADRKGVPVACHAHGDEGARAAVLAGVRSIEHGTYLSDETLRLMKERGTFLVPTVAVVRDLTEADGDYDNPILRMRGRHMLPRVHSTVRRAHAMGIPIVASTDTGYGPRSLVRMGHDIQELILCGLTPMQALQAATVRAAELLGIADRTGRLKEGFEADLIAVEQNPLEVVDTLQDVLLVISDGRLVLNRVEQ